MRPSRPFYKMSSHLPTVRLFTVKCFRYIEPHDFWETPCIGLGILAQLKARPAFCVFPVTREELHVTNREFKFSAQLKFQRNLRTTSYTMLLCMALRSKHCLQECPARKIYFAKQIWEDHRELYFVQSHLGGTNGFPCIKQLDERGNTEDL